MVFELDAGATLRMCMFMTHYRRPADFDAKRVQEAKTILERWVMACEPCPEPHTCPLEVLECFMDDMNTAKVIAILHTYRKNGKGKELFCAMKFLGFFGGGCLIDDVRTLPDALESNFGFEATLT